MVVIGEGVSGGDGGKVNSGDDDGGRVVVMAAVSMVAVVMKVRYTVD